MSTKLRDAELDAQSRSIRRTSGISCSTLSAVCHAADMRHTGAREKEARSPTAVAAPADSDDELHGSGEAGAQDTHTGQALSHNDSIINRF